jgi:hypothetical protein
MTARMVRMWLGAVAAVAVAAGTASSVAAHHSFAAEYDREKPMKITGAVTRVEWTNPHVYFYIDVREPGSSKIDSWAFEMAAPAVLARSGWKRSTLKIGDVVVVDGWGARSGDKHGNARTVTLAATGERLGAATSAVETP